MAAGSFEQGGLLNRPAHFTEAEGFGHVAHPSPKFLLRIGASGGEGSSDRQSDEEGKYVTHNSSLL
jgi:hypothetical protein